jgi:hypothetical protein
MAEYYVYTHFRTDKNEIFYVGIGKRSKVEIENNTHSRSRQKTHSRNDYWKNVVKLNPNYKIEIVFESNDIEEIIELEKTLIKFYGRKDLNEGNLVNMTDGGEGLLNPSAETIEKMKGKRKYSPNVGKHDRSGEKNSMFNKNVFEIWKNKYGEEKAIFLLDEFKRKVSESSKGRIPHNIDKKLTEIEIEKIKKGIEKSKKECKWCKKIIDGANFSKWHGENCTKKDAIMMSEEIISLYLSFQKILPIAKKLNLRYCNVKFIIDNYGKKEKNT